MNFNWNKLIIVYTTTHSYYRVESIVPSTTWNWFYIVSFNCTFLVYIVAALVQRDGASGHSGGLAGPAWHIWGTYIGAWLRGLGGARVACKVNCNHTRFAVINWGIYDLIKETNIYLILILIITFTQRNTFHTVVWII